MFDRQWCRARADSLDAEFDMRVGKEMLLNDHGKVDVNGEAENLAKCRVLRSGCDTVQQEITANDLDWVFIRVLCAG